VPVNYVPLEFFLEKNNEFPLYAVSKTEKNGGMGFVVYTTTEV
jgi:hypothetical protein